MNSSMALLEAPGLTLQIAGWMLLLGIRVTVACMILPPMNLQNMGTAGPMLALMVGAWVAWGHLAAPMPTDISTWILLFFKEALIGAALGISGATLFWVAEAVGVLLDAQTGFNNIQQTEPMRNEENTPLGNSFLQFANTLFFVAGGATSFLWLLFQSYQWWPVFDAFPDVERLLQHLLHQMTNVTFNQIVTYAMGMVGLTIFVDWMIGMLTRVSPKLEITTLAQPIKAILVLSLLATLIPQNFQYLAQLASLQNLCDQWIATGLVNTTFTCRH